MGEVSRRALLGIGITGLGMTVLASCVPGSALGPTPLPTRTPLGLEPQLPQPPVVHSAAGVLDVELEARAAIVDIAADQPISTYTYGGLIPGPTWEVQPGDVLRIRVSNGLPELPPGSGPTHNSHEPETTQNSGTDLTRPHAWTTTNLHTHGLHVSSEGDGDNPFLSIAPGEYFDYEIELPDDHPAGFFWYHPHRHGAVAQQVRGGMGGALIVRGDIDEVPQIAEAQERVMVIQAIELGKDYELEAPIPNPTKSEAFYPRDQILWTINGAYRPRIKMYPGEVQRWRILNAAEGKLASLRLNGHQLSAIAWDGLTLDAPEPADDTLLFPANRVDVLVKAGGHGVYDLVLSPGSSQKPHVPGMPEPVQPPGSNGTVSGELVPRTIATIEVVGTGDEMFLPDELPAYAPEMLPVARTRDVAYTVHRLEDGEFISFGVNGQHFDPERDPYTMQLNTAEEWTITNGADQGFVHVFHIHVNPFLVTKINGVPVEKPFWRDTYVVGPNLGDSFTCVMNLTDFTGTFVQHCHVLTHEDLGMMEALRIVEGEP